VPTDFQNSFIIRLSSKLPLLQYTHDLLPGPSNGTVAADAHQDDDDDKNISWQRRQQHNTVLPSDVTVI